jgi:hypothetical protein
MDDCDDDAMPRNTMGWALGKQKRPALNVLTCKFFF